MVDQLSKALNEMTLAVLVWQSFEPAVMYQYCCSITLHPGGCKSSVIVCSRCSFKCAWDAFTK